MRKVLLIAYNFPPLGGIGVIRPLKFSKYLSKFGWQPVVLTVREGQGLMMAPALIDEIPKTTKVYRTHSWELGNIRKAKRAYDETIYSEGSRVKKAIFKLLRHIYLNFLIPDSRIGWLPFAVIKGRKVIREEGIDIIVTTGGPWTNFLVGYLLARFTNTPLVLDYRDPWTWPFERRSRRMKQVIGNWLERCILQQASRVITISSVITASIQAGWPDQDHDKCITITNGFDPQDYQFVSRNHTAASDPLVITHTGSLDTHRVPTFFLQALHALLQARPDMRVSIQVNLLGTVIEKHRRLISDLGLEDVVTYRGYVPHNEAIEAQSASALLLLILEQSRPRMECAIPGKTFEYLAAHKPILALVPPDGEAANLIRETGAGVVVAPKDVSGIEKALEKMYQDYCEKGRISYQPDDAIIVQYAYPNLARKLADVLDEVVSEKASSGK